jgi:uncharacterized protein
VHDDTAQAPPVTFEHVRSRYIILAWVLLPLPAGLLYGDTSEWEWYWEDVAFYYYAHAFLAIVVACVLMLGKVPATAFALRTPSIGQVRGGLELTVFLMVASVAAFYAVYYPLSFIVPGFVQWWVIESPDVVYYAEDGFPLLANFVGLISLCVITPLLEEISFRGIVMQRFAHKWGMRAGILGSSAVFASMHTDALGAFLFGIGMCVLYLKTGSLLLPILCHAVNNLIAWALELGYVLVEGPQHVYTLEEFRSEWPWGVGCAAAAILWIFWYSRRAKSDEPWRLPTGASN